MKTKKVIKDLGGNELSELTNLIYRITNEIKNFSHVSGYLPESLTNSIEKYKEKLNNEWNKRENQL